MWVYRLSAEQAKRMLLTGDLVDGREAKAIGLVLDAVPESALEERVMQLARRMAGVPRNQALDAETARQPGLREHWLATTQMFSTLFDGIARHSPEGTWFRDYAAEKGFREAVRMRDSDEPIPGSRRTPSP